MSGARGRPTHNKVTRTTGDLFEAGLGPERRPIGGRRARSRTGDLRLWRANGARFAAAGATVAQLEQMFAQFSISIPRLVGARALFRYKIFSIKYPLNSDLEPTL